MKKVFLFFKDVLKVAVFSFPLFDFLMIFRDDDVEFSDVLILAFHDLEGLFVAEVEIDSFESLVFEVESLLVVKGHVFIEFNDFFGENCIMLRIFLKKLVPFLLEFIEFLFVDFFLRFEFLGEDSGFGVEIFVESDKFGVFFGEFFV